MMDEPQGFLYLNPHLGLSTVSGPVAIPGLPLRFRRDMPPSVWNAISHQHHQESFDAKLVSRARHIAHQMPA